MREIKIRDIRNKEKFQVDDEYLNGFAKICGWKATLAYLSLCRHSNKDQFCFPSNQLMADEHKVSVDSIHLGIKTLEKHNIIQVEKIRDNKGKWLTNSYTLLDKSLWSKDTQTVNSSMGTQTVNSVSTQTVNSGIKDTHIILKYNNILNNNNTSLKDNNNNILNINKNKLKYSNISIVDTAINAGSTIESNKPSFLDEDKRLAELLYTNVIEIYPFMKRDKYKPKEKDFKIMNQINRIDKFSYKQIEYVINWIAKDQFWRQNIRSVEKLRKQFDALVVRIKESKNQRSKKKTIDGTTPTPGRW